MPSTWDHKADKDLLLAIIDEGQLKSIIWPSIATKMQAKGYTFTHEACRQHFQKIRKESRSPGSGTSSPAKASSTPRVRKTPSKPTSKTSSFATNSFPNDDDAEDEEFATPLKRKRTNGMKKEEPNEEQTATLFKMEHRDENGVINLEHDYLYED